MFNIIFLLIISFSAAISQAASICGDLFLPASQQSPQQILRSIFRVASEEELKKINADFTAAAGGATTPLPRDNSWPADEVQYMGYVNQIGTPFENGTFKNLSRLRSYFKNLGITNFYLLPFLESPFKDAGFDVRDYFKVEPKLGGDSEFFDFVKQVRLQNQKLQMDLVLNHVSRDHRWAQQAIAGDASFQKYFHIRTVAPDVVEVIKDKSGLPMEAIYRELDEHGKSVEVRRRVIFPEFANPLHPHYVMIKTPSGKTMWVYHTFYPFQFDLNFNNPQVLNEVYRVVKYWTENGADIFRFDAVPFFFKERESDPRTLLVVNLLSKLLSLISNKTIVMVEANQEPVLVKKYFENGANLAYNFQLMGDMWASILTGDKKFYVNSIKNAISLPKGTHWANFLRLHDELSLEMVPQDVREVIQKNLIDTGKGVSFRGGYGVGGRMADFLDKSLARMRLAFAMLMSQNGMPIVYYGDEIMAVNDMAYAKRAATARGGDFDARDVNRGPIPAEKFLAAQENPHTDEGKLYRETQKMISIRRQRVSLRRGTIKIVETDNPSLVIYERNFKNEKTIIVLNLSDQPLTVKLPITNAATDLLTDKAVFSNAFLEPYASLWLDVKD